MTQRKPAKSKKGFFAKWEGVIKKTPLRRQEMEPSTTPDSDGWWICTPIESLIQGPGFDFKVLVEVRDDGNLVIRNGKDPDNPTLVAVGPLLEYLRKYGNLNKLPPPKRARCRKRQDSK